MIIAHRKLLLFLSFGTSLQQKHPVWKTEDAMFNLRILERSLLQVGRNLTYGPLKNALFISDNIFPEAEWQAE